MKQETILKRDDGNKVMIEVSAYMDRYIDGKIVYSINVWEQAKGKRKWLSVNDTDNYTWRRLDIKEKEEYLKLLHLKYVSEEEIRQAKLDLWQKMKP